MPTALVLFGMPIRAFALLVQSALLVVVLGPQGAAAQPVQPAQSGTSLGPAGAVQSVALLAVSPDWPTDPFVYIASNAPSGGRTGMRSLDGGSTWEVLPTIPGGAAWVNVLPGPGRVMVAARCGSAGAPCELLRSSDAGASWQPVGSSLTRSIIPGDLAASADGANLFVADDRLHRSRDAGESWESLDPSPGRHVHRVAISPDFAQDQTIFASVSAGRFNDRTDFEHRATFNDALAGNGAVLVSRDGGDTWADASSGLQLDGIPHRFVQELVISPSFGQDSTLFAFAWGAETPSDGQPPEIALVRTALFRSRDRGATWEYVWEPSLDASLQPDQGNQRARPRYRYRASLVLSPSFANDGVGLLALNWWSGGRTTVCRVLQTSDAGRSWASVIPARNAKGERVEKCGRPTVAGLTGLTALWQVTYDHLDRTRTGWLWSPDGGATVAELAPPTTMPPDFWTRMSPAVLAPDGTVLAGSEEIWKLSPSLQAYGDHVP